jgi:hypothetical protein
MLATNSTKATNGTNAGARTARAACAVVMLLAFGGCDVEVAPALYRGDLEVTWSINGSDAPSLCDVYDIDYWTVEACGPEDLDVEPDCRAYHWTTAADLYGLLKGPYTVYVRAVDPFGVTLARAAADVVVDDGVIDVVDIVFRPGELS